MHKLGEDILRYVAQAIRLATVVVDRAPTKKDLEIITSISDWQDALDIATIPEAQDLFDRGHAMMMNCPEMLNKQGIQRFTQTEVYSSASVRYAKLSKPKMQRAKAIIDLTMVKAKEKRQKKPQQQAAPPAASASAASSSTSSPTTPKSSKVPLKIRQRKKQSLNTFKLPQQPVSVSTDTDALDLIAISDSDSDCEILGAKDVPPGAQVEYVQGNSSVNAAGEIFPVITFPFDADKRAAFSKAKKK